MEIPDKNGFDPLKASREFGRLLKTLRKKHGCKSQSDLLKKLHKQYNYPLTSDTTISDYEQGRSLPKGWFVDSVAQVLRLNAEEKDTLRKAWKKAQWWRNQF